MEDILTPDIFLGASKLDYFMDDTGRRCQCHVHAIRPIFQQHSTGLTTPGFQAATIRQWANQRVLDITTKRDLSGLLWEQPYLLGLLSSVCAGTLHPASLNWTLLASLVIKRIARVSKHNQRSCNADGKKPQSCSLKVPQLSC